MSGRMEMLEGVEARVAEAVREGLTARPRRLPSWLFYDAQGSELFEAITRLEEYYLTRCEREIFGKYAEKIIGRAAAGKRLGVVELGSGTADKTRLLLSEAVRRQGATRYEPVDVSASALEAARRRLAVDLPEVTVRPRVLDFTGELSFEPLEAGERRLALLIGSSLGNYDPPEAAQLLQRVRGALQPGDGFLLGLDLRKEQARLEEAYNDAAGVTAAFNLNLLRRINRELDGDFALADFAHRAHWNPERGRIEMHLVSRRRQRARLGALALDLAFEEGETIHTENSYKYRAEEGEALLRAAGFIPEELWRDERGWFGVFLGRAGS